MTQRWNELCEALTETLGNAEDWKPETCLGELGLDSLDLLDLMFRLQHRGWMIPDLPNREMLHCTLQELILKADEVCERSGEWKNLFIG